MNWVRNESENQTTSKTNLMAKSNVSSKAKNNKSIIATFKGISVKN